MTLRDTIAVLDGLNPSASGGATYSGGSDWFPGAPTYPSGESGLAGGYEVQTIRRSLNPSGSGGANCSGGSDWFPGAPTYPSGESGLASGMAPLAYGRQPALSGRTPLGYGRQPALSGGKCVGWSRATGQCASFRGIEEGDPYAAYLHNDPYDSNEPGDSYDSYLQAFRQSPYDVQRLNPSASGGANSSGGSDWFPGAPTYPSGESGLVGVRRRAALLGALATGAPPQQAVEIAAVAQNQVDPRNGPRQQAYQAAYAAARARGWDTASADAVGRRVAQARSAYAYMNTATHT